MHEGAYDENVNVDKQLTLSGIGMPVVDAGGSGSAITLSADGIVIGGFMVTNSGYYQDAGIKVTSNNNTITNNNVSNNKCGICLSSSSNNTLYHNNLADNADHNAYDTGTNTWDSGSEGNYCHANLIFRRNIESCEY